MEYHQYDIFVFDPEPAKGREVRKIRPCVILSPDEMNKYLATVIVAPMTTKIRNYPFRPAVKMGTVSGCIMLDQIRCIDKARCAKRISSLSPGVVADVKAILQEMLID